MSMKQYIILLVFSVLLWAGFACGRSGKSSLQKEIRTTKKSEGIFCQVSETFSIQNNKSMVSVTKRALVIGLGQQEDRSWCKINGDKDVAYVQEILKKAGYKDVSTLINKQATKNRIVAAFKALTSRCQHGDVVYIHFSGHGQQVTDVNGDEWPDSLDEAWIPYDAYLTYGEKDKGEKHLIDDEINVLLTGIKNKIGNKGKMLVVVDACHSGDSARGDDDDDGVVTRGVWNEFIIPGVKKTKSTKAPERWLTLSACKDFQLNQEIKDPRVGKLTYALYMSAQKREVTFKDIEIFMDQYRVRLPQTPVLTGEVTKYNISDFIK